MSFPSKKTVLFASVLVSAILGLVGLRAETANAALGTYHPDSADNTLIVNGTTGGNVFPSPSSYSYLFVPAAAASASVTIQDISNEVNGAAGRISHFTVRALDGAGNCQAPYLGNSIIVGSSDTVPNNYQINFPASATQNTPGGAYKIYCVHVQTGPGSLSYSASCLAASGWQRLLCFSNVRFRLHTPTGGALLGNFSGTDNASGTGYYNTQVWNGDWSTEWVGFALSCNSPTGGFIELHDLDTYALPTNADLRIQLQRAPRGTSSWGADNIDIGYAGYAAGAGSGATNYHPSNVQSGENVRIRPSGGFSASYVYRVRIIGIGENNKVRVRIPYLELLPDVNASCNTNPSGSLSINCNVTTNVLTISATVSDAQGGTLTVSASVTGVSSPAASGSRNGNGSINLGTKQGSPGVTHTITGTVTDSAGGSGTLTQASVTCNRPPSGTLSISCHPDTARITVTATVTDGDGGTLTVSGSVTNVGSPNTVSGSRTGSGAVALTPSQFNGSFGTTHTISGTVRDAAGATVNMTNGSVTCPALVWITGRLRNAYQPTYDDYANITVRTCRPTGTSGHASSPATATTDGNGYFSFRVPTGRGFCVRPDTGDADYISTGAVNIRTRPAGEDYNGCGPFNTAAPDLTDANPDYCSTGTYENQVAGAGNGAGQDRASNNGYDFALRFRPVITCHFEPAFTGIIEVGRTMTPIVRVTHTSNVRQPSPATGNVRFDFETRAQEEAAFGTLNRGRHTGTGANQDSPVEPDVVFTSFSMPTPGEYDYSATAQATADGLASDGDGNPANGVQRTSCGGGTTDVGNYPYLKTYGGETAAGAGFVTNTPSCSLQSGGRGGIHAWSETFGTNGAGDPTHRGASSQLTVSSLMRINTYFSSSLRTADNTSPKGQTFANISSTAGSYANGEYGGGFRASAACMPDYYNDTRASTGDGSGITIATGGFPQTAGGSQTITYSPTHSPPQFVDATVAGDTASFSVQPGSTYRITTYGPNPDRWFGYGSSDARRADARCSRDGASAQWNAASPGSNSLRMNGNIVPWSKAGGNDMPGTTSPGICSYNSKYEYVYTVPGGVNTLTFNLNDCCVTDNSKGLYVSVVPMLNAVASSVNPGTPDMDANDVTDGITNEWGVGEWASQGQLASGAACAGVTCPWVEVDLGVSRTVGRVNVYDRVNPHDHMTGGFVTLYNSSGTALAQQNFGTLSDSSGAPTTVTFGPHVDNVRRVRVTLTSADAGTFNAGLAEVEIPITNVINVPPSAAPPGRTQFHLSGDQTFGGVSIPVGSQTAVFVDGDVFINGDITYADGHTSIEDMPYFALVVRGNIYIAGNVERLDGLYIAQPDSGTNGRVYTCAQGLNDQYTAAELWPAAEANFNNTPCRRPLAVNGGMIAQRIKLQRTNGSLRLGAVSEPINHLTGVSVTGQPGEVFNYTPQMWLAPSPLRSNTTAGGFDSIRALPPIF